jgi:hypothetical protein
LQAPFGVLYDLVEKIGKAPKERLCTKHLNWDCRTTASFAATAVDLIDLLARGIPDDERSAGLPTMVDARWAGRDDALGDPFAGTIVSGLKSGKCTLNRRVVAQHLTLARVLSAVITLQLRATRPSTLFLSRHRGLLFAPFTGDHPESEDAPPSAESPIAWDADRVYDDPAEAAAAAATAEVLSARRQFILKVVDEVVRQESDQSAPKTARSNDLSSIANVFKLAEWLGVGRDDAIRRQHVSALFEHGRDAEADDYLPSIIDSDSMAGQLLEVAVRQLAALLDPDLSADAVTLTGQLPPAVYEWCQAASFVPAGSRAAGAPEAPALTSPARVLQLLERVLALAPQTSSDRTRAERLAVALRKIGD